MSGEQLVELAGEHFGLAVVGSGRVLAAGHINQSVVLPTEDGDVVLQALNRSVFVDPDAVMTNAARIADALEASNLGSLRFMDTVDGGRFAVLDDAIWRCYRFIDGQATPPVTTPEDAQSLARAFGRYARAIEEVELVEHLTGYHDFDDRVRRLDKAIDNDSAQRLHNAEPVIEHLIGVIDRLRLSGGYDAWQAVPRRNAHNDAKGPNCVVGTTGARTIIDLDTSMPGTLLADIGELVRSSTRHLEGASRPS